MENNTTPKAKRTRTLPTPIVRCCKCGAPAETTLLSSHTMPAPACRACVRLIDHCAAAAGLDTD